MLTPDSLATPRAAWMRAPEAGTEAWWRFTDPRGALFARTAGELPALLVEVERAAARGLWAVGHVDYEAAPGCDPALAVVSPARSPVAAFGLFDAPAVTGPPDRASGQAAILGLEPGISATAHAAAVAEVKAAIARGDSYQVNLTLPMTGRLEGSPEALFAHLGPASRAPYAAYLDLGARALLSLSPELFFERDAGRLRMRPMKGTRPRGRYLEEDQAVAADLAGAAKDRAENLMIVDMARNDLGRLARAGSVEVTRLFELERYPTVWQLTSTVEAAAGAGLPEIFGALFPCASVTGAPKAATMGIIARLERRPRGAYCGALGYVAPGGRARFSVAIRTAEIDGSSGNVCYGVGGGVVWDSDAAEEWRECLAKAAALSAPEPAGLFETLAWRPHRGAPRLERHLGRLAASARHFDLPFDAEAARERLAAAVVGRSEPQRVRLELFPDGRLAASAEPFRRERRPWRVALASRPVDGADPALCHKTTRRAVYDQALAEARRRGLDEPLLWNRSGELTEGARTNLMLEIDGRWLTPARRCGLLAGVFRQQLLETGRVEEAILRPADLARAERVALVNALRGWIPARVVG